MKFSELLEKGEGIARRAVKGGAMLAETGIFEGIPIVGNILNGAAMINEVINGSDDCEGALAELRDTVLLIEPVISQLAEAEHLLHNSEHAQSLHNNLEAVSKTLEDIWEAVQLYVNKNVVIKLATSGSNEQLFIDLLSALKKGLDNLSFMISGEALIAMLNTKAAVDNLAEHLKKLEVMKNAQDARKEGEEQMEIDERLVEWIEVDEKTGEPRPFATGAFGAVFRVKYEGEIVCAKLMDLKGYTTKQLNAMKKDFQKEVALMGALHSTNIVSILGSFTRPREWVILMEYCEGGTLRGLLDRAASGKVAFGKEAQAQILLDISYGMRYLHTHNIIHQDLKSLNVLITASGKGKVADFGRSKSDNLSSQQNNNGESEVGSYAWAAPEVIRDNLTSVKADIFSFAIVMWEVMTKRIPWEGLDLSQIVGKVAYEDKRPNLEVGVEGDPDMVKLMEECWSKVPEGRPEFQRIIKILEPLIGSGGRASPVRLESAVPAVASVVPVAPVAPAIPVAFSPAKSKGGRKQLNEVQNLATTLWTKLLTEVASDDCTKKECPFDDDFVAAVELTLLEGEDLTDAQEDFLRKALCKSGAATAQLAQFKKLIMKWKKSPEYADDFIRYLGVAASIDPQSRSRFGSNDSSAGTGGTGGAVEKEETIDGYWDSGDVCKKRGDFQQAFDYYSRACDGYTLLRGPDDENAVKMSSMCASMLHKLGRVGEAIAEYRIALEKKERIPTMGPSDPSTLNTLSNLGDALRDHREWEEARKVMELCLLRKSTAPALGDVHPDTLRTVNNLGNLYFTVFKDNEKALKYFERALKGYEATLGKTHPSTLATVMNLASVQYTGVKDYGIATVLFERALQGFEEKLGKNHHNTITCAKNLKTCLRTSGDLDGLKALEAKYDYL